MITHAQITAAQERAAMLLSEEGASCSPLPSVTRSRLPISAWAS